MKRRNFIANTAILVGMLATGAHKAWSLEPTISGLTSLGDAKSHMRHGLFADEVLHHPFLPSWVKVHRPHRMFRNGVDASHADLLLYRFETRGQKRTIGMTNSGRYLQAEDALIDLPENCAIYCTPHSADRIIEPDTASTIVLRPQSDYVVIALTEGIESGNLRMKATEFTLGSSKAIKLRINGGIALVLEA